MSNHDPTLFKGCAWWYARYRDPYPPGFADVLRDACGLDGTGVLLDLGCGTGHVAIPIAPLFDRVVAVDPDPEMLAEGARCASGAGVHNIEWLQATAEDFVERRGTYRLVTLGQSFHWMDREQVLAGLARTVVDGGAIVNIGGGKHARSPATWSASEELKEGDAQAARAKVIGDTIARFLGPTRRAGTGVFQHQPELHEAVLARSPFHVFDTRSISWNREATIERTVGLLYSTSFCARRLFGDRIDEFERELTEALLAIEPTGRWTNYSDCELIIARRAP